MTYPPLRHSRKQHSARSYADIGLETEVLSASPEKLITLLMNGALAAMAKAKLHLQNGNIEGRGNAISKAIDIVDSGLKSSVNRNAGGEVANSLITAYELIIRHLLLANLNASVENLNIAEKMLMDISLAWQQATGSLPAGTATQQPQIS